MDTEDNDTLGMLVLEYMLHQKMLGRETVLESEIHEMLGYIWDGSLEDSSLVLTELGEDSLCLYKKTN